MSHIAEPVQVNNSPSIQAVVDQDAKKAAVTAREDRLLATRQRNTLLTIIAALCEYSVLRRYNTEIHRIVGRIDPVILEFRVGSSWQLLTLS